MRSRFALLLGGPLVLLVLSACASSAGGGGSASPSVPAPPAEITRFDLAAFLGVRLGSIRVVSDRATRWEGPRLSCVDRRGLTDAAWTSGHAVVLDHRGRTYYYRVRTSNGEGPTLVRCHRPDKPLGPIQ